MAHGVADDAHHLGLSADLHGAIPPWARLAGKAAEASIEGENPFDELDRALSLGF